MTERHRRAATGRRATGALAALASLVVAMPAAAADRAHSKPSAVVVTTLPPVPGVRVQLDSEVSTTDATGRAEFVTQSRLDLAKRLKVLDPVVTNAAGKVRYRFNRLYGERTDKPFQITFDVDAQVKFSYETTGGRTVDPSTLDSVTLRSNVGQTVPLKTLTAPVWLRASRIVSGPQGPSVKAVTWSVTKVGFGSSNLVNSSEVRFEPLEHPTVVLDLFYFSADVQVRDALFGFARGGVLRVTGPDGKETRHTLGSDGKLALRDLPRGEYTLVVLGGGLHMKHPAMLSRSQEIDLRVISYLDAAVLLVVMAVFAGVPIVIGRRRLARRRDESLDFGAPRSAGAARSVVGSA